MNQPRPRVWIVLTVATLLAAGAGVVGLVNARFVSAADTAAGDISLVCPHVANPVDGQRVTCVYRVESGPPTTPPTTAPPTKPPAGSPPANATNTGTRLASHVAAGGDVITGGTAAAPQVVSGKVFASKVTIRASNVVVRDSIFNGGVCVEENSNVTLEWVTIRNGACVASAWGTTLRHTEIYGGSDLVHLTSDRTVGGVRRMVKSTVLDTVWAHDPTAPLPAHVDGIQIRGLDTLTVQNSHFDLGTFQDSENAGFFTQVANGGHRNIRIKDTWFNGGGITFRYEGNTEGYFELINVSVQNSYKWGVQYTPKQGSSPTLQSGNRFQSKDGTWAPLRFL